jgi:hypothetical protein
MVCKCSLVERLDLLPMAMLLMSGGKLPARRAKSAHFVGHLPGWRCIKDCGGKPWNSKNRPRTDTALTLEKKYRWEILQDSIPPFHIPYFSNEAENPSISASFLDVSDR